MLEFKKRVLQKVSFDAQLFEKELSKALQWLMDDELEMLKKWCYDSFGDQHKEILDRNFLQRMAG